MTINATPSLTVADLLERLDTSWSALLATLDDLTDEQLEEPGAVGEWSLKNTLGHIGYWDDLGREQAALAEERAAMHQAHAALVAALEEREGLEAAAIDAAIAGATYEHYDEHAVDVRAWREQRGY